MTPLAFRAPRATDAIQLWQLAPQPPGPARDSCYALLLLCTHFADTGIVAARGELIRGFALGYRPPMLPEQLFVRLLGVAPDERDGDLGMRLLDELLARGASADVRYLCMTHSRGDAAVPSWFAQLARRRRTRCAASPCFPGALFGRPGEDDSLLRLGPIA